MELGWQTSNDEDRAPLSLDGCGVALRCDPTSRVEGLFRFGVFISCSRLGVSRGSLRLSPLFRISMC